MRLSILEGEDTKEDLLLLEYRKMHK